jgi:hypothetical protein
MVKLLLCIVEFNLQIRLIQNAESVKESLAFVQAFIFEVEYTY